MCHNLKSVNMYRAILKILFLNNHIETAKYVPSSVIKTSNLTVLTLTSVIAQKEGAKPLIEQLRLAVAPDSLLTIVACVCGGGPKLPLLNE